MAGHWLYGTVSVLAHTDHPVPACHGFYLDRSWLITGYTAPFQCWLTRTIHYLPVPGFPLVNGWLVTGYTATFQCWLKRTIQCLPVPIVYYLVFREGETFFLVYKKTMNIFVYQF